VSIEKDVSRVAIVGLGSIGRRHLRLLKELCPRVEVIAVRSETATRVPEEALVSRTVYSLDQAMDFSLDAAIVCTPAPLHLAHATPLVQAGVPVLIEKPLSHTLSAVAEFEELANRRNARILIGCVFRHCSSARLFYDLVKAGLAGQIVRAQIECRSNLANWRPGQDYRKSVSARKELGGGVLLELSHEIDFALWFFGPFSRVAGLVRNTELLNIDVEDSADLVLERVDKCPVYIHVDFCSQHDFRRVVLIGSEGTLVWDVIKNHVKWTPLMGENREWSACPNRDEMYRLQLAHFIACAAGVSTPLVSLADGISVLRIIDAAKNSNMKNSITLV
jgi:predicted dehydrogenase